MNDVHPKSWTKNLTFGVHFYILLEDISVYDEIFNLIDVHNISIINGSI